VIEYRRGVDEYQPDQQCSPDKPLDDVSKVFDADLDRDIHKHRVHDQLDVVIEVTKPTYDN